MSLPFWKRVEDGLLHWSQSQRGKENLSEELSLGSTVVGKPIFIQEDRRPLHFMGSEEDEHHAKRTPSYTV